MGGSRGEANTHGPDLHHQVRAGLPAVLLDPVQGRDQGHVPPGLGRSRSHAPRQYRGQGHRAEGRVPDQCQGRGHRAGSVNHGRFLNLSLFQMETRSFALI